MRLELNIVARVLVLSLVPLSAGSCGTDSASARPPVEAVPTASTSATAVAPDSVAALPEAVPAASGSTGAGELSAADRAPTAPAPIDTAVAGGSEATSTGDAAEPATAPTFHVFLLLGQSNMAGYPKAQAADRLEDPRVRVLGFDDCAATGRETDQWDVAAPPLHECWNDGLGPGDYFAKSLLGVIPASDSIGLVPCAISGERIETFLKVGGTRYDYIVRRARLAQSAGGIIEGILFHQGESNSGDPDWPGKVNTLVTDLRTDLGIPGAPFLAGELLYTGGTSGHNVQVNRIPATIGNAFVISASGLVVDPSDTQWNLHFSRDAQVELGRRYAEKMIDVLGWR